MQITQEIPLESDSSRGLALEAKTKTLSSQVNGSRSMTEGGADTPSIRLIYSCLAYANTSVWGQLDSYWLVNSGDDMCHQISFDPMDNTFFQVCHLEKLWKLWVCRAANNVNHISHPPITVVFNNHCHASFDVRKQRVSIGP